MRRQHVVVEDDGRIHVEHITQSILPESRDDPVDLVDGPGETLQQVRGSVTGDHVSIRADI